MAKSLRVSKKVHEVVLTHATFNHRSMGLNPDSTPPVTTHPYLKFGDTLEIWQIVLGVNVNDAANAILALRRLTTTVSKETSESADSILSRLIKDLRRAAQNTNAFVVCLAEAESHGLFFENINEAIRVFRWIDIQCEADVRDRPQKDSRRKGRRAGRVQKDMKYWNAVIATTCHLFTHFHGHWACGLPGTTAPSSEVLITSFELAHTINGTIPPCAIVRVVQTASDVGIGSELIKNFVMTHHPTRLNDWTALMRDGLLTKTTYKELASRPELVAALSYDGLKRLLTQWQSSDMDLLDCARQMTSELYPDGVPMGTNPKWEGVPTSLIGFLRALKDALLKLGRMAFNYPAHDASPGMYVPENAAILLEPPSVAQVDTEEIVPASQTEPSRDPDVVALLVEQGEACEASNALLDELRDSPEPDPEPAPDPDPTHEPEATSWSDIHELIAMDAREGREGIEDSCLQALLVDIGEIEHLLDLAARGETDDVLGLWSAWMDPIRDRIREVDARLKNLASRPPTVIEVAAVPPAPPAPEPAPEPEPEPDPEPVLEPEPGAATLPEPTPVAPVQEHPQLPEGELGELFTAVYSALARLPAGSMKRQFNGQLEVLRTEALSDGNVRSLKPRILATHKEITELLEVIS